MKRIETVEEMMQIARQLRREGKSIGLVPTMGYLHEGHLALAGAARKESDMVIMSIFVNPAQFGPGEDFETYPRDLERDCALAEEAGVDYLFHPTAGDMYPQDGGIRILPGPQADVLCGSSRPGHFDGVLKVICKLFNITSPDRAYFGEKDAQQLAIIETFVRDFNFPVEIRRVPIVREEDGLAKSSRNVRLSDAQRNEAPAIRRALECGEQIFLETGNAGETLAAVRRLLQKIPGAELEYAELLEYPSLKPADADTKEIILAAAVGFGSVRLIDNVLLPVKETAPCTK
ncbi:pantoate--beta-alanine ligase [Edaphobacillus lindanitolerans]|uniref:Pantothenate synthetase n=1 Tax=Edaphobacillus lindanitolerans TaxID=550447 RepID=A0A1U7PKZ5_9BACI|nr:pantoate--beta-alanine ligase [Edaphobacillus lindanitolerans]SIT66323.1 pantoate--beta-alanine ligase [Edaphobacillus lindanitolerans]